ncbi:7037_t:CDS:2 [Paraglomus occultum]|uniref:7037_t:CDS:1 n=1 Tax=Paraglomus occultum TaxID=144539 RepID=A0A9N9A823_9GLOM|nr:7037_t:CDS:2 [Paraglomus occultum]
MLIHESPPISVTIVIRLPVLSTCIEIPYSIPQGADSAEGSHVMRKMAGNMQQRKEHYLLVNGLTGSENGNDL